MDIVDEALYYFKSNVFFQTYEVKSGSDLLLIYLTLYIQACLKKLEDSKPNDRASATRQLAQLASDLIAIPGDGNFSLQGFFPRPADSRESDTCRQYWKQLRDETNIRVLDRVYSTENGSLNKFWMCFSKRKFLNKAL